MISRIAPGLVAEQAGECHRRADGAEGAVWVDGQAGGRRTLDARAHLVADDEGGEQVAPCRALLRDDLDAGMATGVEVALVHVDPGAGRCR